MSNKRKSDSKQAETQAETVDTLVVRWEELVRTHQMTASETFTLLRIRELLRAKPDGKFAEELVSMLQGDTQQPVTDEELFAAG